MSVVAGCTAGEGPTGHRASLWLELVADRGLKPSPEAVQVDVAGGAPALDVRICAPLDAEAELAFADALYGAEAFAFDGSWERVDTAEVRAEVAPLLRAGECAATELPVDEADEYRVLVPVGGLGAWGDG